MKHNTFHKNYFLICFCLFIFSGSWGQTADVDTLISLPQSDNIKHIAYTNQPSWLVTNAISTVEGEKLGKTFSSNFGNSLLGRLPGLTVVRGGSEAGADSPRLYARGIGTFSDQKDILVIVDGFETWEYARLVPEEIESVTLLKDAASASMYGGKGANGVLLINTKRGMAGPLQISFSGQVGLESATSMPDFLGSYDYATLYNEALKNDGFTDLYTEDDLNSYKSGNSPYFHPDVDWYSEVLREYAPFSKYNLSFKGGLDRARYFVSMNALSRDGLYKKTADLSDFSVDSKYKQYNIRTNVDIDLTKSLTASVNLGVIISNKSNPAANTTAPVFDLMSSLPPNVFPVYNPNNSYGGNALYTNPWGDLLETGYFTSNQRYVQSSISLIQKLDMILSGLSASAAVSFNDDFKSYSTKERSYLRYSISDDGTGNPVYVEHGTNTSLEASESEFEQWRNSTFQAFINYDFNSGRNLFHAKLGYNLDQVSLLGEGNPYKHLGLIGRFTYAYNKKYIGELAFAYSGVDGLAPDKRFGLFPGVSVGWIISNEEFLKESNILSFLKIHGSYGITGNDYVGEQRFMYKQYYDIEGAFRYGMGNTFVGGYAEAQLAYPDLSWETEREMNIGFEAVLAKNLNISFDFFKQDRIDILASPNKAVPMFLGATIPKLNIGEVSNRGFEATVGYSNDKGSFRYFVDLGAWYARNKIVFMSEAPQIADYMYRTGQPVDQPFLLEDLGFFQDQTDIDDSPQQLFSEVQPGDLKYKDMNNDGFVDQRDVYPNGYTDVPELTFSFNTGFKYKIMYLDMLFVAVTNRSVYLSGKDFHAFQQDGKASSWAMERWTPATASSAIYPRLSSVNNQNNFTVPSTFWQRDGSFVKLQYAEIGIKLPKHIIERIKLSETRIFINGTNLFTLDKVKVADSEILSGYPAIRSYSIGVKIQF